MQVLEEMLQQTFRFGHINIPASLVFWSRQYCYAMIPIVQLLPGHILIIPRRQVLTFTDLEPAEIFDLSLTMKFLSKHLETFFSCHSTTIQIQSFNKHEVGDDCINHCYVHMLPRRPLDIKKSDDLYPLLDGYDKDFMRQFNNTLGLGTAFSAKMNETLSLEAKKYKEHFDKFWDDEIALK